MDILASNIRNNGLPFRPSFLVDEPSGKELNGYPVCSLKTVAAESRVTIAVGEPKLRVELAKKCENVGLKLSTLVSERAFVADSAEIGAGTIVAPFCSIQSLAKVGSNVSLNTQSIIGHHVKIGDNSVISSQVNVGGSSSVGKSVYIGMGAGLIEKVSVGDWAIVGMGSVVYKDVPPEVIAVGNPARVSRNNEKKTVFK
jgi:sugar O-acyltransferase (sialic acid O-acetyltransferase NeuD family)